MSPRPRTGGGRRAGGWARGARGAGRVVASLAGHGALLALAWGVARMGPPEQARFAAEVVAVTWDVGPGSPGQANVSAAGEPEEQEPSEDPGELAGGTVTLPEATTSPTPAISGPVPGGAAGAGGGSLGKGPDGGGPPKFFQLPVLGRSVVLLIDRSTSMADSLPAAKREAAACIGRLPESAQFQIILYNRDPTFLGGRRALLPATPEN